MVDLRRLLLPFPLALPPAQQRLSLVGDGQLTIRPCPSQEKTLRLLCKIGLSKFGQHPGRIGFGEL